MIEINLAPITETENKFWYLTDLVLLLCTTLIFSQLSNYYIHKREETIQSIRDQTLELTNQRKKLEPDLARYGLLVKQISDLKTKIEALEQITISKLERYLPVLLMEKIQSIKPDGIWFRSLNHDAAKRQIKILGNTVDSLYLAEFMRKLNETKEDLFSPKDLTSQIYFKDIQLNILTSNPTQETKADNSTPSANNTDEPSFDLIISYEEKQNGKKPIEIQDRKNT